MMATMMKSANCIDCLDVQNPINLSHLKHRQWAEADAKFLMRTISAMNDKKTNTPQETSLNEEPVYVCRQKYLRSYTFVKEDEKSVTQKTKKWLRENCMQNMIRMKFKITKAKKMKLASTGDSNSREGESNACSLLEAVSNFLFLCMAKVDVDDDHILLRQSTRAASSASVSSFASSRN